MRRGRIEKSGCLPAEVGSLTGARTKEKTQRGSLTNPEASTRLYIHSLVPDLHHHLPPVPPAESTYHHTHMPRFPPVGLSAIQCVPALVLGPPLQSPASLALYHSLITVKTLQDQHYLLVIRYASAFAWFHRSSSLITSPDADLFVFLCAPARTDAGRPNENR